MQIFYENAWGDYGCAGAGFAVGAVALAIFAAVLGGLWLVMRRAIRRAPDAERPQQRRVTLAILYGSGTIMILTLMATMLSGTTLHRAALAADAILLDYCDSLTPRRETVPLARVRRMDHRLFEKDTPSDVAWDALVITLADGTEHVVPLDTDMPDARLRVLRQAAPRHVFEAWRATLIRRGKAAPDRIFGDRPETPPRT